MVEVRLLEQHLDRQTATQAIATRAAIASVLSKEGHKKFEKLMKGLTNGNEQKG